MLFEHQHIAQSSAAHQHVHLHQHNHQHIYQCTSTTVSTRISHYQFIVSTSGQRDQQLTSAHQHTSTIPTSHNYQHCTSAHQYQHIVQSPAAYQHIRLPALSSPQKSLHIVHHQLHIQHISASICCTLSHPYVVVFVNDCKGMI
jgi:hypothetical protein